MTTATVILTICAIWVLLLTTIFGGIAAWAAVHDRRIHARASRPIEPLTDEALERFLTDLETNPPGGRP